MFLKIFILHVKQCILKSGAKEQVYAGDRHMQQVQTYTDTHTHTLSQCAFQSSSLEIHLCLKSNKKIPEKLEQGT